MILNSDWRATLRRGVFLAATVAAMSILVACGGGSNDSDDGDIVATTMPGGPTATQAPDPEPSATATDEATSTPANTATATVSPTPMPLTPTPTRTPTPTATPLPTVTTPFGEVRLLNDHIQNFTLTYSARFQGLENEDGSVEVAIEQANPESYHLRVTTAGQQTEAWRAGEQIYVLGPGGAVVELPGLVDQNLYAPSSFIAIVPDLAGVDVATVLDDDVDLNGRSTTHYAIDPAAAAAFRPSQSEVGDDAEGVFEVWVDNELGIILQMVVDVEWTAASGSQTIGIDYMLTNIGTTPEIAPPA